MNENKVKGQGGGGYEGSDKVEYSTDLPSEDCVSMI